MTEEHRKREKWNEPTDEELLAILRGAGWLLEQESAITLERAGFEVTQSWAFQDQDEPTKSREIDVAGYKKFFEDTTVGLTVAANVIIECKASAMPWAMVGRSKPPVFPPLNRREVQYVFDQIDYKQTPSPHGLVTSYASATEYLGLHELNANPWARNFEATVLTRLNFKKNSKEFETGNSTLMFETMFPMAKALTHLGGEVETYNAGTRGMNNPQLNTHATRGTLALYFPLIVCSGPLYRVDYTSGAPVVAKAEWVPLRRRFDSMNLKGEFRATVVQADALDGYMNSQVLEFANAVAQEAEKDPARFLRLIDRMWERPAR